MQRFKSTEHVQTFLSVFGPIGNRFRPRRHRFSAGQREEHLRSPDFFDIANHPTITFESRRVSGSREHFEVTGDLTISGQTREVALDVTFNGVGRPLQGFPPRRTSIGRTST
jgi:hypothetical protein